MARGIGQDELALRGGEVAVRDVNGNALLAFGAQTIGQQREIDFAAVAPDRIQLIFIGAARVVQQSADERGFAVVDAPCGREPQQILGLLRYQKLVDIEAIFQSRSQHQKYPSRFFNSMEPSRSWSITRFSRSELRTAASSAIIFGTVSASERIAPVQGEHPSDRMLQRTSSYRSTARGSTNGCSGRIRELPRTRTRRSCAK